MMVISPFTYSNADLQLVNSPENFSFSTGAKSSR